MMGAGSHIFAVWSYVIASMEPDVDVGFQVELNPKLLAAVIGDTPERMQEAIDFLCAPDPMSRSEEEGGRRMMRVAMFDYRVVNGMKYSKIRNEESRREQNRLNQQRCRNKMKQEPAKESEPEIAKPAKKKTPTIEEVAEAAKKAGMHPEEAEKFFNYYESNGWRVGKNEMKSWPHALSNWNKNSRSFGKPMPKQESTLPPSMQRLGSPELEAFILNTAKEMGLTSGEKGLAVLKLRDKMNIENAMGKLANTDWKPIVIEKLKTI